MALDRQTAPLEIAQSILRPETLHRVRQAGFSNSAYLILDRWALNSPDELQALEQRGELAFLVRLDQQQAREAQTLNSDPAWEMSRHGMSDWEILQQFEIDTELRTIE